jgi:hypothetical protein
VDADGVGTGNAWHLDCRFYGGQLRRNQKDDAREVTSETKPITKKGNVAMRRCLFNFWYLVKFLRNLI